MFGNRYWGREVVALTRIVVRQTQGMLDVARILNESTSTSNW